MKRSLIALAATAFVVAAIGIARANSGDSGAPTAAQTTPADIARDRAQTTGQVAGQSEQVLKAQADLAARVRDAADTSTHTLVVTIREDTPGKIWTSGTIQGKPACVTPPKSVPSYVAVYAEGVHEASLANAMVPLEAELLKSGACQATVELFVPQVKTYEVSIRGTGMGRFGPVLVRKAGTSQKVILAG